MMITGDSRALRRDLVDLALLVGAAILSLACFGAGWEHLKQGDFDVTCSTWLFGVVVLDGIVIPECHRRWGRQA